MALYEELQKGNIYGGLERAVRAGELPAADQDGIIRRKLSILPGQMWIHTKQCADRDCNLWAIYFGYLGIIPRGCRSCWKVTVRPRTLKQAIAMEMLQSKMDLPSKTGMEARPRTAAEGGFNSFWYAPLGGGLEGGRDLWKMVLAAVRETFGDDIDEPMLKRGCTEMEHKFSPSSKWDEYAEQSQWDLIEDLANEMVLPYEGPTRQPSMIKRHIMTQWIEWGFEHSKATGDFSYKNYIEANKLPELEHFERSIHSAKDFKSTWRKENGTDNKGHNDAETEESGDSTDRGSSESVPGDERTDSPGGIKVVEGLAST